MMIPASNFPLHAHMYRSVASNSFRRFQEAHPSHGTTNDRADIRQECEEAESVNVNHLPGVAIGDPRCACVSCDLARRRGERFEESADRLGDGMRRTLREIAKEGTTDAAL